MWLSSILYVGLLCDIILTGNAFKTNTFSSHFPCSRRSSVALHRDVSNPPEIPIPTSSSCVDECDTSEGTSTLIIDKTTDPTDEEIADANLVKIVMLEATDQQCNDLFWNCLGYRYDAETQTYDNGKVFPKWRGKYPNPPDVIGVTRNYADVSIDKPVRDASMNMMRGIPRGYSGSGVKRLTESGWTLWKLNQLTPNKTRRAQLCNWLIYYREKLHGKTIEQLRAEREAEREGERLREEALAAEGKELLPSERNYKKLRIDE